MVPLNHKGWPWLTPRRPDTYKTVVTLMKKSVVSLCCFLTIVASCMLDGAVDTGLACKVSTA